MARVPRIGGDNRARTGNPRLAKAVLSQLSYIPKPGGIVSANQMVGLDRFELSTSRLSGVRSDQLSYRPDKPMSVLWKPRITNSVVSQREDLSTWDDLDGIL